MKKLSYTPNDSSIVYIWSILLPLLAAAIIAVFLYGSEVDENGVYLVYSETWFVCLLRIITALLLVGLFLVYNKTTKTNGLVACGIKQKTNAWNAVLAVVLVVGVALLTSNLITLFSVGLDRIGITVTTGIDIPLDNFGYYVLAVLMICVLPAISEELVYRGIVFNGLKSWGKWPAILVSAAAFSLMHGAVEQLPYTFILGIIFGYVMWETGALWLTMLMHFINNFLVVTMMYAFGESGLPESVGIGDVFLAIGLFALAVLFTILVFYLMKKVKDKEKLKTMKIDGLQKAEQKTITKQENKAITEKRIKIDGIEKQNKKASKKQSVPLTAEEQQEKSTRKKEIYMMVVGLVIAALFCIIQIF